MPRTKKVSKMASARKYAKKKVEVATKAYVQRAIKGTQETRYNDSQRLEQNSSTIGTPYFQDDMMVLNTATVSAGQGGLVGDQIQAVGMSLKLVLNNNSNAIGTFARILVLNNKLGPSNIGYRTGVNIFDFDGQNQSTTGTLYDLNRMINKDLYSVHYDRVIKLGTSPADASSFYHTKIWIPMKGKCRYESTGGNADVSVNNKVLLVIVCEAPNDLGLGVITECTSSCRFYYKDG